MAIRSLAIGGLFLLFQAVSPGPAPSCPIPAWEPDTLDHWIGQAKEELLIITSRFELLEAPLLERAKHLDSMLRESPELNYRKWRRLWRERQEIADRLDIFETEKELQQLKIRYKKGIDLIKLLYEKILALDHHFSGMQIYQNILLLSNPNTYPDFQKNRDFLEEQLRKKNALELPAILHSNPYMSAAFSLLATFIGEGEPKERQKELERISCILDFTVRMGAELSIIQHETEYLKTANQALKQESERLFEDYVKVVGYLVPLEKCRSGDDWENVYLELDEFIGTLSRETSQDADPASKSRWAREQVNLEFATQRVADFIGKYQSFVNLGSQYYQKFDNITSTYENEEVCKQELPRQFEELRLDIRLTIEKFSNTYILPEIQGSRMKDLLYGSAE